MRRVGVTLLFALSSLLAAWPSVADEPAAPEICDADAETCGRRSFDAGIDAYQAKKYAEAAEHFQKAYELRPHPIVLFNLALAQVKLELYVEAVAGFDKAIADPETPKDMLAKIKQEKTAAERKVSTIEVDAGSSAEIFVDEKLVTERPARVQVNPGDHKLRAVESGKEITNRSIHVAEGERLSVSVARTREVVIDGPAAPKAHKKARPARKGLSPTWFYVSAGVTVVLGGLTTWSALDTKRAYDDYKNDLPKLSQSEVDKRVDDGHGKELRTNMLLGGTAVAAAGTVVLGLFGVDWGGQDADSDAGVSFTPNGVHAFGRF
jgi:tetratricopeptide (TPR) repeat protein